MFIKSLLQKINPMPRIDKIVGTYVKNSREAVQADLLKFRVDTLTQHSITTSERGISETQFLDKELVVSLTTYGERIFEVYLSIESIMHGTIKPNRIVLWLARDEFEGKELPITLQKQISRGLEVRYTEDILSYKKIVPSLKEFPDSYIITIDDDLIYNYDFVEKLVVSYKQDPHYIYAYRVHKMHFKNDSELDSYLNWQLCCPENIASHLYFFTTGGGVLFPPKSLVPETLNSEVFMDICRHADDVWINAMSILSGNKVKKVYTHDYRGDEYIVNTNVQRNALYLVNNDPNDCQNDKQIAAVFKKYGILDLILKNLAQQ